MGMHKLEKEKFRILWDSIPAPENNNCAIKVTDVSGVIGGGGGGGGGRVPPRDF